MIESASYVFDPEILGFFEATSTQQLVSGEGIAGKALGTNQQLVPAARRLSIISHTPCFITGLRSIEGLFGKVYSSVL